MLDIHTLVNGLSLNIALLLSLTLLCNLLRPQLPAHRPLYAGLAYGALFGGIAVTGMLMHIEILPGVSVDGRVVIAGLAGAFAGPVAGVTAGLAISSYRLAVGGVGTLAGIGAILTAACLGSVYFHRWERFDRAYRPPALLAFGIILAIQGLAWSVVLPPDIAGQAFRVYCLPVMFFYPLGTLVIGTLLANERRHLQTRDALQASEEQVREAFVLSRDALYKRDLATKRYIWISPAVKQITGVAVEQWLQMGENRLREIIHPADRSRILTYLDSLAQFTSTGTQEFSIEYRIQTPADGTRWILDRHIILVDARGRAEFVVGNLQDVTHRKHAEVALENYKHIVSSTKDLMALVDREHVFMAASQSYAAALDATPEQIIGQPIARILDADNLNTSMPLIRRCLAGEDMHDRAWVSGRNGKRQFLDTSYYPHFEKGSGRVSGYVISIRDLTDYQHMEEKLLRSYKMEAIGTLAGGIAHDFNNILGAVMGYAELARSMTDDAALQQTIGNVRKAGQRATELVKQILTFSRQTEQEVKPVYLKPLVKEALKLLRASIPASIRISRNLAADCYVMADPTQLHQIVMNLCTNASYAMKDRGGRLTVGLEEVDIDEHYVARHPGFGGPGRYVNLSVTDTGIGIPPEVLERIFEPFFTTKPEGEGTGMGLATIHGIVKNCCGDISVYSRVGHGTTIRVFIPVVEHLAQTNDQCDHRPLPTGTERVLFVDDDPCLVDIGERMLTRLGYRVSAMSSSMDALRCFSESPDGFDLVITDLTMPDMNGDRLAAKLLSLREDIPIIVITGFSEEIHEAQMQGMGIRKVILKPIITRQIAESIREVLDPMVSERVVA